MSVAAVDHRADLARADAAFRAGCFDCLREALTGYESLTADPTVGTQAREGAVRTAVILAVRETELGLVHGRYIERARELMGPGANASPALAAVVDIGDVIASGPSGFTRSAGTDAQITAMLAVARRQDEWAAVLRNLVPGDLAASYLWLSLACGPYASTFPEHENRDAILADVDLPLFAFKTATACGLTRAEPMETLLAQEPRFQELNYYLGLFALGGQTSRAPDLDAADDRFRAAYEWRTDWPTLTLAIANVAMSAEDFPRAFTFYDRTLALSPDDADALTGTVRALTYSNRHDEAIAGADRLIALRRNPGEAHYWKAVNLVRLKRDDDAWQEIEAAAASLSNADVPKLAGIIAINRRDFTLARQRLELSYTRRRADCETGYYLQAVASEQREWERVATVAAAAGECFDDEEASILQELATVRASLMAPDRRARVIARREQQLAAGARMRAAAWFNAAAGNFNLSRTDEARRFAEKVADDSFFGERARDLIERTR